MRGTAPRVDFWLLLEYSDIWDRDPVKYNKLPATVQHWLDRTVKYLEEKNRYPRVQMIRRDRAKCTKYSVYTAEHGELRHHSIHSYDEILDLDVCTEIGAKIASNVYFVCTHGTRDKCCAKFGHRTWRKLNELSNGRAWQCSHLGGHRFAPNILVLPQGRLYGRVHVDEAASFYRTIENDEIALDYLRGRSELVPEDQVYESGVVPVRDQPIEIRESCSKTELKVVTPFIEI